MHLVCLGVMRRLLISGPLSVRIGRRKQMKISSVLTGLQKAIPAEFARKPRSLSELARWKATELRQFLLYTGIVVLKNNVHESIYKNFLLLSVAIRILSYSQMKKIALLKMNLPILFWFHLFSILVRCMVEKI